MVTQIIDNRPSFSGSKDDFSPGIIMSPSNLTPRIISTLFILALKNYFISHPEYRWDPDDNKTEIDIHADWEEDDNLGKGLPVLVVQNGPVSISPVGIGSGIADITPRILKRDGKEMEQKAILDSHLQTTIDSSVIISVTGMSADDVNELAFDIGMFMMMLKYDVASILQLQQLSSAQISPAQAMGKTGWTNRYMSQLSLAYSFTLTRRWEPTNIGELIKDINIELDTKTKRPTTSRTYTHNTVKQIGD